MAAPLLAFLGSQAKSALTELYGPAVSQSMSEFRNALGWNDIARARAIQFEQNWDSCTPRLNDNYTPFRLSLQQAITAFNQGRWPQADDDRLAQRRLWERLQSNLRFAGVNIKIEEQLGEPRDMNTPQDRAAYEWARLIGMSSEGPPLHVTVHDYYRSTFLDATDVNVTQQELNYQLQRATIRRTNDRNILMRPFFHFDHTNAYRLKWMGLIGNPQFDSMLNADGCIRQSDRTFLAALSRQLPSHGTLLHWAEQGIWNEPNTALLHLDDGFDDSPIPRFFTRAQGLGVTEAPLPGEPDGEKDWMKLAFRSTRKTPSFSEACHLLYRLRPDPANPGQSVVPGVDAWTDDHTKAALIHEGFPKAVAEQLAASPYKVVDPNFAGATLGVALEHARLSALKRELFGPGNAWLENDMMNFGFSPKVAKFMTAIIHQMALDKAFAERDAKRKAQRAALRDGVFKRYEQGTIRIEDVYDLVRGKQFTDAMTDAECENIDEKVIRELDQTKIDAIRDAYFNGNLSPALVRTHLESVVVNPERIQQYLDSWLWERTSKLKQQSTSEILAGLKAGLISAPQAVMRLTNIGWRNPDAIAEVALVANEMQISQQKAAAALQAHQAALIAAEAHKKELDALNAKKELLKKAKEQAAVTRAAALANHGRLMVESSYYAKVHTDNHKYAKAKAAGDQELMDAEIQKSAAAYQKWLVQQIELITSIPGTTYAAGQLQTQPTPNTGQGQGDDATASNTKPPPAGPPKPPGGTDATGGTKPAVP